MFAKYKIIDCPYSSRINSNLYKLVRGNVVREQKGGARITAWDFFNDNEKRIEEVGILLKWIKEQIPQLSMDFAAGRDNVDEPVGFFPNRFKIDNCWGLLYDKGQAILSHNHFPYSMTFSYCVNAPKGSKPLSIEGERINVKEGQVVFFLAHQFHIVETSNVDGRCVITGNILYNPK